MKKIVLATRNKNKVSELRQMLAEFRVQVLTLNDFPEMPEIVESGNTFQENARLKAEAVLAHTGFISIADDSGLAVDALNGAPGVHSARYAENGHDDEANNRKLLQALKDIPLDKRTAVFCCVIAIAVPNQPTMFFDASIKGIILHSCQGEYGFGYDPLFWLPEKMKTMAQLNASEKNALSHRGQAYRKAVPTIQSLL